MRIRINILGIFLLHATCISIMAQELAQVIRGQVIDIESQTPLPFASVSVTTSDSLLGTIADGNGYFRFTRVPVGRYDNKRY